jgi:hypothetical protein
MRMWQPLGTALCVTLSLMVFPVGEARGQERPSPPKRDQAGMDARMLADLEILRDLELLRQLDVLQKLDEVRSQPSPGGPKTDKTDARGNP